MEDEEFLEIENALVDVCARLGAPELTEARFYVRRVSPDDPEILLPPRERVVAQIDALERYISLFDRRTHDAAIEKIQGILRQSTGPDTRTFSLPSRARVIAPGRSGAVEEIIELNDLPALDDIRRDLRALAGRLKES